MKLSWTALCSSAAVLALAAGSAPAQAIDPPGYTAHKAAALKLAGPRYASAAEHQCGGRPGIPAENRALRIAPGKAMDNLYYVGMGWVGSWAIVAKDGSIVLIDTLDSEANADEYIVGGLKKLGLDPANIKLIILTHNHADHTSGVNMLRARYHMPVIAADEEWKIMEERAPGGERLVNPPKRDLTLVDGQTVTVGGTPFTLIKTPGHTPGSTSVIFPSSDHGKKHLVALVGGVTAQPNIASQQMALDGLKNLVAYAKKHPIDVELVDHVHVDDSMARTQALAGRKASLPSEFVIGAKGFQNFLGMLSECYQANIAKLEGNPPKS